jgi:hypothetical protein
VTALAIVGGRVWDATRSAPLEGATVLIEDGRIASVSMEAPPSGVEQIDARGQFVMPGLVDMHVHVQLCGEDSLYSFLGTGITSVRDVGSDIDDSLPMREALASGERVGPRLFVYGPLLDGEPSVLRGALGGITRVHATVEEGVASVEELIERGVDGLKLYAGLRPDLVGPMVEAAGGRVPVTGHLGRTWASEAVALGIDCLEHVHATAYQDVVRPEGRHTREGGNGTMPNYWSWLTHGWARADLDADHVRDFIAQLVEHEVAISPTTVLIGGLVRSPGGDTLGHEHRPRHMRERDRETAAAMARLRESGDAPAREPIPAEVSASAQHNQVEFLRRVHAAGGRVLPSTDVGAVRSLNPGFSLHSELELLVEEGFSNADVLRAATLDAAQVLRADESQGALAAGQAADAIILDDDPLEDITATRKLATVVKDGVAYDPAELLGRIDASEPD